MINENFKKLAQDVGLEYNDENKLNSYTRLIISQCIALASDDGRDYKIAMKVLDVYKSPIEIER